MTASHSFAGEHVEDGSGEKDDADRYHRNIEHAITSGRVLEDPEILISRWYHQSGRAPLIQRSIKALANHGGHDSRTRPIFGPESGPLARSSALSYIKVREALTLVGIRNPSRYCEPASQRCERGSGGFYPVTRAFCRCSNSQPTLSSRLRRIAFGSHDPTWPAALLMNNGVESVNKQLDWRRAAAHSLRA
jgi:hypothetical protein